MILPVAAPALVPRTVHLVWVGSDPPPHVQERWSAWDEHLPLGFSLRHWTDATVDDAAFGSAALRAACPHPVVLSDFVRIEAVARYGGIYLDSDMIPLRPIDVLADRNSWVCPLPSGQTNNAAFGFSAFHPTLARLWAEATTRLGRYARHNYCAGPPLWHLVVDDSVDRLDAETFYPLTNPAEIRRTPLHTIAAEHPLTLAVHEFDQSWQASHA